MQIALNRRQSGGYVAVLDVVADEQPLEIQIHSGKSGSRSRLSLAVVLRTPGDDFELIAGFLYSEGILSDPEWIANVSVRSVPHECRSEASSCSTTTSIAVVDLSEDALPLLPKAGRSFYVSSGCGVCGKASLMALRTMAPVASQRTQSIDLSVLVQLPYMLRGAQRSFKETGGMHAVGLFTLAGDLVSSFEDVGRHNAMDKVIGRAFLSDSLPLRDHILMLSGRASYELLQKAVMAGVSLVASVGAPSSLAVELARAFDIGLIGFMRGDRFNIYHGAERVRD